MLPMGGGVLGSFPSPGAEAGAVWIQTWVPTAKGEQAGSFICLMTTAPRICNHALTVYKAVFTPISSC